jgi:hypothetical protein
MKFPEILLENEEEAKERRDKNEWNVDSPDCDEICMKANALFEYLEAEGNFKISDKNTVKTKQEIELEIKKLQQQYDEEEDFNEEIYDRISELEDVLEDYDNYVDLYSLIPVGDFYDMTEFKILGVPNESYVVGTSSEMDSSLVEYAEGILDDIGYENYNQNFLTQFIDDEKVVDWFEDFYNDDLYNEPDAYFEDSQRNLSTPQSDRRKYLVTKREKLEKASYSYKEAIEETDNQNLKQSFIKKLEDFEEEIENIDEEIDDIESDPEGDFPDELIRQEIEERLGYVRNNPLSYIRDWGLDLHDFIDRDSFIQGVIEEDGNSMIAAYDGNVEEIYVKGEIFYVFRNN